jgi:hypothetical protein
MKEFRIEMPNEDEREEADMNKMTYDSWGNPVHLIRIGGPRDMNFMMDKAYIGSRFNLEKNQKEMLFKILKGLRHSFLQASNIRHTSDHINIVFEYDLTELKKFVEYNLRKKRRISENQLLVLCKSLIDLGALFENYFCYIPEISLMTLKIFKMGENENGPECGIRLQNPFLNDDYLFEIIKVS